MLIQAWLGNAENIRNNVKKRDIQQLPINLGESMSKYFKEAKQIFSCICLPGKPAICKDTMGDFH